jgi:hypothetical protein
VYNSSTPGKAARYYLKLYSSAIMLFNYNDPIPTEGLYHEFEARYCPTFLLGAHYFGMLDTLDHS